MNVFQQIDAELAQLRAQRTEQINFLIKLDGAIEALEQLRVELATAPTPEEPRDDK